MIKKVASTSHLIRLNNVGLNSLRSIKAIVQIYRHIQRLSLILLGGEQHGS